MSASEDERRARLAAALKQNISRRKAQSRAREAGDDSSEQDHNGEHRASDPAHRVPGPGADKAR
jgi:hypothetical protein